MQIERRNFREELDRARLGFDIQLAERLRSRLDLGHAQIQEELGISARLVRRVIKQFNIDACKRGAKPRPQGVDV